MLATEWMQIKGLDCEDKYYVDHPTMEGMWDFSRVGVFLMIGVRECIADEMLTVSDATIQAIVDDLVELHAGCLREADKGRLCTMFEDAPQQSSIQWALDWAYHISTVHGGLDSEASGQIADLVRYHIPTNPFAGG